MSVAAQTRLDDLRHFTTIADLQHATAHGVLEYAIAQKKRFTEGRLERSLLGKTLAMIFQKPSLRTRVSFEVAMTQLGGTGIYLDQHQIGLGQRETTADIARVMSSMCDGIVARVFSHRDVEELVRYSRVPVINGLSDRSHPCQAMADVMTIREHFGQIKGKRVTFVGDGNNVARSLAMACGKFAMQFTLASPTGYDFPPEFVERIMSYNPDMDFLTTSDPVKGVRDADVVYADTWTSMGQESEKDTRVKVFRPYQVNAALLAHARPWVVVMHCLPAYRGIEITSDVLDGPRSIVFAQAENRLHFQRALLELLMGPRRGVGEVGP